MPCISINNYAILFYRYLITKLQLLMVIRKHEMNPWKAVSFSSSARKFSSLRQYKPIILQFCSSEVCKASHWVKNHMWEALRSFLKALWNNCVFLFVCFLANFPWPACIFKTSNDWLILTLHYRVTEADYYFCLPHLRTLRTH